MRGATRPCTGGQRAATISIHAPHAGCDDKQTTNDKKTGDFNPRTPCGVRQDKYRLTASLYDFNPRTPCGVRRGKRLGAITLKVFQSTHPMRGATREYIASKSPDAEDFNPRTPCGVRPGNGHRPVKFDRNFNPRTPCGVRQQNTTKSPCSTA